MKSLDWVIKNEKSLETPLDSRFGRRLYQFLTSDQAKEMGFENVDDNKEVVPWTEENILKQLKEDVEFGIEKATNHRGISAGLMWEVCNSWCKILENGLELGDSDEEYGYYGHLLFKSIDEKYNFGLVDEDTFDETFFERW